MSLKEEDRRILVALELERAEKTLREMEVQFQNELWAMVANRLYKSKSTSATSKKQNNEQKDSGSLSHWGQIMNIVAKCQKEFHQRYFGM